MGLFNDSGDNRQDEVVIDAPEDDSAEETRLGREVGSSLVDSSDNESVTGASSDSDVSLDDIHRQNETIIDLLEQLVDNSDSTGSSRDSRNRSNSRNSNRVTGRGSSSSNRVTDRKDSSNDESIGDGMNELL